MSRQRYAGRWRQELGGGLLGGACYLCSIIMRRRYWVPALLCRAETSSIVKTWVDCEVLTKTLPFFSFEFQIWI
jgi:hypothetical protein